MFARLAYQRVSKAARYGLGKPNRKFVGPNAELSCRASLPDCIPQGPSANRYRLSVSGQLELNVRSTPILDASL